MKMENLGFADTVRRLAEKAGISIVEEVYDAAEERRRKARTALLVAHKKAAGFSTGSCFVPRRRRRPGLT